MKRLVGKKFVAGGKRLIPGDVVDVTGWRNLKTLESGGWLKPLPEEKSKVAPVETEAEKAEVKPVKKAAKPSDGSNEDK